MLRRPYTPDEVATLWGCSARHVRNLIARGELRAFRIGSRLFRIPADALEEIERCRTTRSDASTDASSSHGGKTDDDTVIVLTLQPSLMRNAKPSKSKARAAHDRQRHDCQPVGSLQGRKEGTAGAMAMGHEWKAMGPFWGAYRPTQVTVALCRSYVAERRGAGQARRHHLDGTRPLAHGAAVWKLGPRQGAASVERPPKPAPRERFLTHAEIDRLLAAPMAHHIRLAILLMLSTAARVGAVLELTWERVDFRRGQIDLRVDAVGPRKGRAVVPINAGLRAALQDAKRAALTDYVIEWAGQRGRQYQDRLLCGGSGGGIARRIAAHVAPYERRAYGRCGRADAKDLAISRPQQVEHH